MSRAIIHVDMDAFYASVEQRDEPSLKGKAVIVGGHPRRGVVLAASYEVRPLGVKSAMPMSRAIKLAPDAIVVPPRFAAYAEASEKVFAIFERYTPLIEALSLDEAFLDVSGCEQLFGKATVIARKIRDQIRDELSLPASAGIAEVKFVAKIASDLAKPDGQREVPAGSARTFLAPLPIARLWGVGPKTEARLLRQGLRTIGDVAVRDPSELQALFGDLGAHLSNLSRGVDDRVVVPDREAKSIGAEDTFEHDLGDEAELSPRIHAQALRVARRLRRAGMLARVVVLKLKGADFKLLTRRVTLETPTDDGQTLHRVALELLEKELPLPKKLRLTGVSAHDLRAAQVEDQLGLFAPPQGPSDKVRRLNQTLDRIADRYGSDVVLPADLTRPSRR